VIGGGTIETSGIIVLDKPAGFTSQDAVAKIRRLTGIKKVGHTGTLDKFATGVLPILTGACTRLASYLVDSRKSYEAVFSFGSQTDTLDPEGSVVLTADPPDEKTLKGALPGFTGKILQIPPEYSAIHVGGKRAHELMRSGEKPNMEARQVEIYSIELVSFDGRSARLKVDCSKGTYIRSLARDLGLACGSAAHVIELRRTRTAGFSADEAIGLDAVGPGSVRRIDEETAARIGLGLAYIRQSGYGDFRNGKKLSPESFFSVENPERDRHAVFGEDGELKGIVRCASTRPEYCAVLGGA
jgi:tRNA pseudouridine55 synthase